MIEFVIFGSTGDLTLRKVLPALELLKKDIKIIAVGRRHYTDEEYKEFISTNHKYSEEFLKHIHYVEADISKEFSLDLKDPIFFFATAPEFYENIVRQLNYKNAKAIFEKPFGEDEESAKHLNEIIRKNFKEENIFRIDHYLGKETVQNILILRFANAFLEPIWNNKYINNIQIIIDETLGIEKRGQYYDKTGAINDMFQNHILQIISLLMMDEPKDVHEEKYKILKHLKVKEMITGQYEGYHKEEHVRPNSKTETFFSAIIEIENDRYRGIPIFVRTGKKMKEKQIKIKIEFKKNKFFKDIEPNILTLNIAPVQDIQLSFNTKKAGIKDEITKANLDFCHKCTFKENSSQDYEKQILDVINGDNTLFITEKELTESWKITDNIERKEPIKYKENTIPKEATMLAEKYGFKNANL